MSKIARKTQLIFGSTPGFAQMGVFGSLANNAPAYSTDPAVIQSLSNYLVGWYAAVVGENSPAIQDMNALCYLYAYQLAYLFQQGIAEYDSGTTYFIGSQVTSGLFTYVSLVDNNLGNALNNTNIWKLANNKVKLIQFSDSPYTSTFNDDYLRCYANAGAIVINLSALSTYPVGYRLTIKKVDPTGNTVTINGNGGDVIDFASSYVLLNPGNSITLISAGGTNWDII